MPLVSYRHIQQRHWPVILHRVPPWHIQHCIWRQSIVAVSLLSRWHLQQRHRCQELDGLPSMRGQDVERRRRRRVLDLLRLLCLHADMQPLVGVAAHVHRRRRHSFLQWHIVAVVAGRHGDGLPELRRARRARCFVQQCDGCIDGVRCWLLCQRDGPVPRL